MKTYIFFAISFLLIALISCSENISTKELENNFSRDEIVELEKIITFYKTQISANNNSNFKAIYEKQLKEFSDKGKNANIYTLDFNLQEKLCNSLNPELFSEIWSEGGRVQIINHSEYNTKIFYYNSSGKYLKFLADVGKYNTHIKEFLTVIENLSFGIDTTTWLEQTILMYPNEFDLNDPNIQLIISIHHLSQNDDNNRMKKMEMESKRRN